MSTVLIAFIALAIVLRFVSLAISIRHEAVLKAVGATEYNAFTSTVLAIAHTSFYLAAIAESFLQTAPINLTAVFGMGLYAASMVALFWVIRELGPLWTVKIMIAPDHTLVTSPLFRTLRHPNYFLNIVPELIGFSLALQAFDTLAIGLPIYAIILFLRIQQEEKVMRDAFIAY